MDEKPLRAGMIRCVFVGGPLDGKTTDVDAYLSWQTPPESITAAHPLESPGVEHLYVRDGEVEDRPGVGRHLLMRHDGERPKPPAGNSHDRAARRSVAAGWGVSG
jgi:hypothetical protein